MEGINKKKNLQSKANYTMSSLSYNFILITYSSCIIFFLKKIKKITCILNILFDDCDRRISPILGETEPKRIILLRNPWSLPSWLTVQRIKSRFRHVRRAKSDTSPKLVENNYARWCDVKKSNWASHFTVPSACALEN